MLKMYFLMMFNKAEKPSILPQNAGKCVSMRETHFLNWIPNFSRQGWLAGQIPCLGREFGPSKIPGCLASTTNHK